MAKQVRFVYIQQLQRAIRYYFVSRSYKNMTNRVKIGSRPQSARTQETKLTLQSEANISTFSETDTFLTKRKPQEKDDFGAYVDRMNKKGKYNLPTITEKKENDQLKNQTCKPFQRRRSSNTKPPADKIDPQNGRNEKPTLSKTTKLDQLVENKSSISQASQKSNKFIDKTIRKMNELSVPSKPQDQPDQDAVRINFAAFVANDPLKRQKEAERKELEKREKRISEDKVSTGEKQEIKNRAHSHQRKFQEIIKATEERKRQTDELNTYVNAKELRNMDNFPLGYEAAIEQASKRFHTDQNMQELQKLDVSQFNEFGDGDIVRAMDNIRKLDRRIEKVESGQTLDNTSQLQKQDQQLQYSQDTDQKSLTQSSLSMLKRNNNLFLTEILKGNLSRQDLQTLVQMQKSHNKLTKLEVEEFESESEDQEDDSKVKDRKFIEKNKIQAAGGLFLECDYLAEEHKKRLAQLMQEIQTGQDKTQNPFDLPERETEHLKRLDQGISIYQNMFQQGRNQEPVIYEESLPKDPILRRQSQLKILRDKINSVNTSLRNIQNIPVDRFKIQSLVAKLKEMTVTRPPSAMIQSTRREFDEIKKKVEQSEQFLQISNSNRQAVVSQLEDIKSRFLALQQELRALDRMSDEEILKMQRQELQEQKQRISRYQEMYQGAEAALSSLEEYTQQLRQRIREIDQVDEIEIPVLKVEGFSLDETIEEIDARISKKAESTPAKLQ